MDQVGNWDVGKLDLDGNGTFTGTDEYNDDRTHNEVNELEARDTDDDGNDDLTLSYDEVGNLVDDGEEYEYVWDAFGRLRKVLDRSDDSLVAEYRYNGLAYRISVHADTDDDGDVDGDDKWFHSAYNPRWQQLAVFREDDPDPKEEYVPHLAGLDGRGGSSYIDAVVLRFKDADTAWTSASDGTLEEKIYYCQSWRADVSTLVKQTGAGTPPVAVELQEWVKYSAYGVPFGLPGGDTDSDGDCDATDVAQVQTWISASAYDARGDVDLNGLVSAFDKTVIEGVYEGIISGRGNLSSSLTVNHLGFTGRQHSRVSPLLQNRYRWLDVTTGRWLTRDLLGYKDGPNLYLALSASPITVSDPTGLISSCSVPGPNTGNGEDGGDANAGRPSQSGSGGTTVGSPFGGTSTDVPGAETTAEYQDCCRRAWDNEEIRNYLVRNNVGGAPVCCDGKKVFCSFMYYHDSTPDPVTQRLIDRCVREHERSHKNDTLECTSVLRIAGWRIPEEEWPAQERIGGGIEHRCLSRQLRRKNCDRAPNPETCRLRLEDRREEIADFIRKNGGVAPSPTP